MEIYKAPHILIIHLKRFRGNQKMGNLVRFPIRGLDISEYVMNKNDLPPIYDLFAISNHFGGVGGGHYMAYAMNPLTKTWHEFNDSSVNSINEENLVTSAAYVLFYRRRDLEKYVNLEDLYSKNFQDYEIRDLEMS
jgi:ubiquitin carboxyl-terminal hydrolase 4/11/15